MRHIYKSGDEWIIEDEDEEGSFTFRCTEENKKMFLADLNDMIYEANETIQKCMNAIGELGE